MSEIIGGLVRVQTFFNINSREWLLVLVAAPLVVAVRVALWVLPSRVIVNWVGRLAVAPKSGRNAGGGTSTVIWAIDAVSRRIPRATCLTQAIAAKLLLRVVRVDAQLCLGVARSEDGALRAHAWLERDGRPVLGGAGIHAMVRLPDLPAERRIAASLTR